MPRKPAAPLPPRANVPYVAPTSLRCGDLVRLGADHTMRGRVETTRANGDAVVLWRTGAVGEVPLHLLAVEVLS